jgi:hypothetical protein
VCQNSRFSPAFFYALGIINPVVNLILEWVRLMYVRVPCRLVPRPLVLVTIRLKRSSPMDRHLAPPISGSWSRGAARAVDGASLLHGPLRVDRNAETEKKLNGWTKGRGTKHQGTVCTYPPPFHDTHTVSITEYTECWPCPLFLIFYSISIILLASLVAGRRPQCIAGAD